MKKRVLSLILLVACIFSLLAGCTININLADTGETATSKEDNKNILDNILNGVDVVHVSYAMVCITPDISSETVSNDRLNSANSLLKTYEILLQSPSVKNQISEEYPGVEYTLSLKEVNNTQIYKIVATSKESEHLTEICDMATSLFCENVYNVYGFSCKITSNATSTK